jgi:16S rRNA (cytosine967-C5)-methyltransferase
VERWVQQYGTDRAERICAYDQRIPRTALRGVTAAGEPQLMAEGVRLQPGELLRSARLVVDGEVTKSRAYREGRVWIQDEASQLVARLVGKGSRLLDCCAAPGGKTAAMAERNPDAPIVAVDLHPARARLLRRRVAAGNVHVISGRAEALPLTSEFDRILADVPCSGTGTLARNPEIKWRLKPEDLADLHARQVAILRGALSHLAPGGRLVYSTCSLEPEENEQVVDEVLRYGANLRLRDCRQQLERLKDDGELAWSDIASLITGSFLRTLPGVHPCDGFFTAVIERAD